MYIDLSPVAALLINTLFFESPFMFTKPQDLQVLFNVSIYCSSEIFDRKCFIDKIIQGKILSWIHDFLKIFLP